MTTTYLYIRNMVDNKSIEDVKKLLTNLGYRSITIGQGEAKFGTDNLLRNG